MAFAVLDTEMVGADILAGAMRESSAAKMVVLAANAHARVLPMTGGLLHTWPLNCSTVTVSMYSRSTSVPVVGKSGYACRRRRADHTLCLLNGDHQGFTSMAARPDARTTACITSSS